MSDLIVPSSAVCILSPFSPAPYQNRWELTFTLIPESGILDEGMRGPWVLDGSVCTRQYSTTRTRSRSSARRGCRGQALSAAEDVWPAQGGQQVSTTDRSA